ncbi:hypodermin-A-like [Leguminivora glycinivorella]|uniref:hypodermin-A-like n=1 Tax=Leguminivora glycinivorella TaxID=1035111 RepID=UPI00200C65D3|nr:hypodermin-A-like [Leguminivora glycinivorella]
MTSKIKVIIIIICNITITYSDMSSSSLHYPGSNMSGHLINGIPSSIIDFPHSAYLAVQCNSRHGEGYFSCGASIVNQAVLLTAGHCIIGCHKNIEAFAIFGHDQKDRGTIEKVSRIIVHEHHAEGLLSNDIALLLLRKDLKFSCTVRRVALMRNPPNVEDAIVAGWGRVHELSYEVSNVLMSARQKILLPATCLFTLNNPAGTFCADSKPGMGFPASADSGSAIVINDFIQIGLVSYVDPHISKKITVYTNIRVAGYETKNNFITQFFNALSHERVFLLMYITVSPVTVIRIHVSHIVHVNLISVN